jgi:hypothetical protein
MSKKLEFLKHNWFKILITLATLLIAFSIFYYFVIFIPKKEQIIFNMEREKIEEEKQTQLAEEQKKQEEKQKALEDLNSCMGDAENAYNSRWNDECDFLGNLTNECKTILIETYSYSDYLEKEGLSSKISDSNYYSFLDYLTKKGNCSCRLPSATAERFNEDLKESKNECYKKYPQK